MPLLCFGDHVLCIFPFFTVFIIITTATFIIYAKNLHFLCRISELFIFYSQRTSKGVKLMCHCLFLCLLVTHEHHLFEFDNTRASYSLKPLVYILLVSMLTFTHTVFHKILHEARTFYYNFSFANIFMSDNCFYEFSASQTTFISTHYW